MSISDTILAFKQRRLDLDCIDMTLVQCMDANPVSFRGRGYIRQGDDGNLLFKIYAAETKNTDMFSDLKRTLAIRSGEIYPDSSYFGLSATAFDRTVWTADQLLPDCSWPAGSANPIVTGKPWVLATDWDMPDPDHALRLHFLEEADIPCIVDTFTFSAVNCQFTVRKHEGEFILEAHSKESLDPQLHTRIQEALRFLFAQSVAWRVLSRQDSTRHRLELASAVPRSARTRLDPPIAGGSHAYLECSWRLFSLYLDYVTRDTAGPHWHACSYHLHNACEASANSIDAWAIGLSVAVEGIASLLELGRDPKETARLEELRTFVLEHVAHNAEFSQYTKRVQGLLSGLTAERAKDKLWQLAEQARADQHHVAAWSELRNKGVHPNERDLRSVETHEFQRVFDLIHQVTVLMYHVVFSLIGYEGKYTDYASRNYPVKDYPLQRPAAPTAAA